MDHRITITVVAVFGGTLAFTFLTAAITTSVGPNAPQAALVIGDGDDEPSEARTGPSPREQLTRLLQTLDRSTEQWKRDHGGRHPDFQLYPEWEQLLHKTDPAGRPDVRGTAGVYLGKVPVNPLNKLSSVVTVDHALRPADRVPASAGRVGFVYSTADRCYWGTNGSGRVVLARSAQLPSPAVSEPAVVAPAPPLPSVIPRPEPAPSPVLGPTLPVAPPPAPTSAPAAAPAPAPSAGATTESVPVAADDEDD